MPPELLEPDAAVWQDQRAYYRYMTQHRWSMPSSERMGCTTSPANRRGAAAAAWAVETGVATRTYGDVRHPSADWHRMRGLGLCG